MKLTFTHAGQPRTLQKHARVQHDLAAGTMSAAEAARRPWYLRLTVAGKERPFRLQSLAERDAIREAKDFLATAASRPNEFTQFLQHKDALQSVTIGELAADWLAKGCPKTRSKFRTPSQAALLAATLRRCLPWWSAQRAAAIRAGTIEDYAAHRSQHHRPGATGLRSADLELAALSSLCQWAVSAERLTENPFATRDRVQPEQSVVHCHERMPDNDQQFHAILNHLFSGRAGSPLPAADDIIAGAYLCFGALTGLRPGEPEHLLNLPESPRFPENLKHSPAGLIHPMPDGTRRMKVHRLKRGQNTSVTLHPVLDDFLHHWRVWLRLLPSERLFPLRIYAGKLNAHLDRACRACGLPPMKPHGFMRAYYCRVRRSAGAENATIAAEIGQTTLGSLIRSTYGDSDDPLGGNLYDWLPALPDGTPLAPAWHHLTAEAPANVIAL